MSTNMKTLELSPLDLIPPKFYTRIALLFRTDKPTYDALRDLQASLDKTCRSIPWIAGKVVQSIAGRSSLHVEWAECDSPTLKELGSLDIAYKDAAAAEMPLTAIPEDRWPSPGRIDEDLHRAGAPVFAGGLLSFSDGQGVALCLSFHHNVMDAGGMAEVLRLWTSVANGQEAPVLDYDRISRLGEALKSQLDKVSGMPVEALMKLQPGYARTPLAFMGLPACASSIQKLCVAKIETLKDGLRKYTAVPATANTIISALTWCAVTRTRYRRRPEVFEEERSKVGMAVDSRARIHPNFATSRDPYFGNAYVYAITELDPHALNIFSDSSYKTLAAVCDAIAASNSTENIDASHIAGLHSVVSRVEKLPALFPAWSIACGRDFGLTSWANLGIYEQAFGLLGLPDFVRMPYTPLDSAAIVLPRRRTGACKGDARADSIEVVMMLRKDDLEDLQSDSVWNMLAA